MAGAGPQEVLSKPKWRIYFGGLRFRFLGFRGLGV